MRKFLSFVTGALLFAAAPAQAAMDKYAFDTAHTQIFFAVDHLGFSKPQGKFKTFSGSFSFDPEKVEKSSVAVSIDPASIDFSDAAWEEHLRSADFFNVAQFPAVTFKSTKVEKTGENTGNVTGDLTLLGVTKPVTLNVTFNKAAISPVSKKYVVGFGATAALKRSDWGMVFGLPGVGDEVSVTINVEGVREEPVEGKKK